MIGGRIFDDTVLVGFASAGRCIRTGVRRVNGHGDAALRAFDAHRRSSNSDSTERAAGRGSPP
jgi:hypothetical protein